MLLHWRLILVVSIWWCIAQADSKFLFQNKPTSQTKTLKIPTHIIKINNYKSNIKKSAVIKKNVATKDENKPELTKGQKRQEIPISYDVPNNFKEESLNNNSRISPKNHLDRFKREIDDEVDIIRAEESLKQLFANLKANDGDRCLARMVCEMATGNPAFGQFGRDVTDLLLSLNSRTANASQKYFKRAAIIGRRARSIHTCTRNYHLCQATFEELVAVSRCFEQGQDCIEA